MNKKNRCNFTKYFSFARSDATSGCDGGKGKSCSRGVATVLTYRDVLFFGISAKHRKLQPENPL